MGRKMIVVRDYSTDKDGREVEEVERRCEIGPNGKLSLFTDLLGDPLCRIRHSPAFLMLVAEIVEEDEGTKERRSQIVGMIRGCIKTVTRHSSKSSPTPLPVFTKLAYILGLRVSPSHRRMGIASKLVNRIEEWFSDNGAEYSYLATESDNDASVSLFTHKCGYSKFRTPSVLVQPVFAHRAKISGRVTILRLSFTEADPLYRHKLGTIEFFPCDIDSVLSNQLTLGTFLAVPRGYSWPGPDKFLSDPPESWAILSVWNCNDLWRLEVKGASSLGKGLAWMSRAVDRALPFLKIPSFPELFKPFGLHFLYGLGGEGPKAVKMVKALCGFAHNLAQKQGCSVVATEVSSREPLRLGIPHWKKLSCADLWCMKRLGPGEGKCSSDGTVGDWIRSPPGLSIFVDPREF